MLALLAAAALAQGAPPDFDKGNPFAKDVCTEVSELASDEACFAAMKAQARDEEKEAIRRGD